MEHAKKYALIPEETFSKHVPSKKQMTDFDREMSHILNSSLPDHEKVQKYYELLKRKMNLEENNLPWMTSTSTEKKMEQSENTPKNASQNSSETDTAKQELLPLDKKEDDYSSIILGSVPTTLKKQAGNLLQILKSHPNTIRWNKQGEIFFKDQKYEKSNLADLFNLIFTNRRPEDLAAKNEFIQALQELNVPKHFIKNKQVLKTPVKEEIVSQSSPQLGKKQNVKRKRLPVTGTKNWESY